MESASSWDSALINELTQGMEQAKQLRLHLLSTCPSEAQDLLLQRILSSYEKALLIINWSGPAGQVQVPVATLSGVPESSVSVEGSPKSDDLNNNFAYHQEVRDMPKKRKMMPTRTEQVRINPENGLEGPHDDGFSWRKYGQKDILGAKYPRSYYRCTYRLVQNCWATKQVQRSDDDPTVFEITYKGEHTCNQSPTVIQRPASSAWKQELESHQLQDQNERLMNLRANLRVDTEAFGNEGIPGNFSFPFTSKYVEGENHSLSMSTLVDNQVAAYSPLFLSPATSGSNYFSTTPSQLNFIEEHNNFKYSEPEFSEIVSGHASTANSPIGCMGFPYDAAELDPNPIFPFTTQGY